MKLDVILSDHKLQCFRTVMGSSVHYRLLAVDKAEIKQWLTLLFFSPPPPLQVKMGCAVCLLGLSQDLPERCCYFQLAVLLTQIHSKHFLFFLYLLYVTKIPKPIQPTNQIRIFWRVFRHFIWITFLYPIASRHCIRSCTLSPWLEFWFFIW